MQIEQKIWTAEKGWRPDVPGQLKDSAQLVILFGCTDIIKSPKSFQEIQSMYPRAQIIGCSTAGEIYQTLVTDGSLVSTAIKFDRTHIEGKSYMITDMSKSFEVGEQLIKAIPHAGLKHVFVLSDGINVNGSELVKGITHHLPANVAITGGLSGDGTKFKETYVVWNNPGALNTIAILGFYGESLKVGYSSLGGWDSFGPDRIVTKSKGNILYELDGQSALALYKKYLGEHAKNLPASGLLFPLSLRKDSNEKNWIVRTILAVNEENQSMTFAGDVPEGCYVRLMKANFERLIDGASGAARGCLETAGSFIPQLAILISCVGRKMVLEQRIEEEVEAVRSVLGQDTVLTGFYSYGEISPFTPNVNCELHNQTMTITTFFE